MTPLVYVVVTLPLLLCALAFLLGTLFKGPEPNGGGGK